MGLLIILLGGILAAVGYKLTKRTPRFETVKSTSGRTVKFLNYPEAKKHKRSTMVGRLLILTGIILISIGIFLVAFFKN